MPDKRTINEYLFYEFGYDLQQPTLPISDDWPFELQRFGTIHLATGETEVYEFTANGEAYFALSGAAVVFFVPAGLSLEDLELEQNGTWWITQQDPVGLATSCIGDESIPSVSERRTAIEELGAAARISPHILEGLYLRKRGTYLALLQDRHAGKEIVVGTGLEPYSATFPGASAWRRLCVGIGKMLKDGTLS
jgi:hypothetical protein